MGVWWTLHLSLNPALHYWGQQVCDWGRERQFNHPVASKNFLRKCLKKCQVSNTHLLWYNVPVMCLIVNVPLVFTPSSIEIAWKISRMSSNKDWRGEKLYCKSHNYDKVCMISFSCCCCRFFSAYRRVWVDVDVTFLHWEKEDAGATVDDVTNCFVVFRSKFWSQLFCALQQILNEFCLWKREKQCAITL